MTQKKVFPEDICKKCGIVFIKTRTNRTFCSPECAKFAWNIGKGKAWFRARYAANPDKFRKMSRAYNKKIKDMCYAAYGGYTCACPLCPETNEKFLTLDHINNDGASLRKMHGDGSAFHRWLVNNNFPQIVQVLCYNCNCGKNVNGGICPHFGDENVCS